MLGVASLLIRLWRLLGMVATLSAVVLTVASGGRVSYSGSNVMQPRAIRKMEGENTLRWVVLVVGAFVLVVVVVVRHGGGARRKTRSCGYASRDFGWYICRSAKGFVQKIFYASGRDSTHPATAFFSPSRALSLGNTPGSAKKSCTASG
jgi:hypothetical protein